MEVNEGTKSGKNEFLALLCNLYTIFLLVALPLYTGEGYWHLGDTKYQLFRNVTLFVLGVWIVAGMPERIRTLAARSGETGRFSAVDLCMAAYALCVVVSALCSGCGKLAWAGYEGWYMGAVSQLIFVGIYFFVSRQCDHAGYPLWLGEAALGLVTLLGLLHRLGIDPLRLLAAYDSGNWEYSHMMSTLGNINWLCGFYSVALAFPMAHFLRERRRGISFWLFAVNAFSFLLLFIQGSMGGVLVLSGCVAVSLLISVGHEESEAGRHPANDAQTRMDRADSQAPQREQTGMGAGRMTRRVLAVLTAALFLTPVWGFLMRLRGDRAAVVLDGNISQELDWYVWWIAALLCLAGIWATYRLTARTLRRLLLWFLGCGAALVVFVGGVWLINGGFHDGFGSGRGFLWRISLESFAGASPGEKLIGVGPDCFGEAVFRKYMEQASVWDGDHWEGAVFTNAHSEPLTQLLDLGVLGALAYFGIFAAGVRRYRGMPLGLLALSMYGLHSLVSFQQVLNAPFLFLALGLCESRKR